MSVGNLSSNKPLDLEIGTRIYINRWGQCATVKAISDTKEDRTFSSIVTIEFDSPICNDITTSKLNLYLMNEESGYYLAAHYFAERKRLINELYNNVVTKESN